MDNFRFYSLLATALLFMLMVTQCARHEFDSIHMHTCVKEN